MILFIVNGLDLRVFDAGRELARKSLSPLEAATLASDLLDGLRDHITPEALRGAQEGEPDISRHCGVTPSQDAHHRGLVSTAGGNA